MAASQRIKAQNIIFKIGATDYACDATLVELALQDAPGDVQTFCEYRVGGQWTLQLDGVASGDAASLYQLLWANFGTKVAFSIAPNGNSTATADEPIYEGTAIFDQLPPLSLNSNQITQFSVTLTVDNLTHDPENAVYYGVEIVTA